MIPTKFSTIVEKCAEKHNIPKDMLQCFSDFIFTETKTSIKKMDSLIINLPGFINYFYSRKRLLTLKEDFDKWERGSRDRVPLNFDKDDAEKIEIYSKKVDALLETYEQYLAEKREVKKQNEYNN